MKNGHGCLGALDRARKRRGLSLRYILKYSREKAVIFSIFLIQQREKDHFVASRRRWLDSQEGNQQSKRVCKMSGMKLGIKE